MAQCSLSLSVDWMNQQMYSSSTYVSNRRFVFYSGERNQLHTCLILIKRIFFNRDGRIRMQAMFIQWWCRWTINTDSLITIQGEIIRGSDRKKMRLWRRWVMNSRYVNRDLLCLLDFNQRKDYIKCRWENERTTNENWFEYQEITPRRFFVLIPPNWSLWFHLKHFLSLLYSRYCCCTIQSIEVLFTKARPCWKKK